jgi:hypothetical protein
MLASHWVGGVYFWTAWSPPIPFVVEASRRFPNLSFALKYYEGGNAFAGELLVDNGEVVQDVYHDLCQPTDETVEFVRDNFDPEFNLDQDNEES